MTTAEEKREALRAAGWHSNGEEGSSAEMWARQESRPWMSPEGAYQVLQSEKTTRDAMRGPAPGPSFEYRMLHVSQSAQPEDIVKLLESVNEAQGWRPVCFVPWVNLSNARVSGYILLEREKRG